MAVAEFMGMIMNEVYEYLKIHFCLQLDGIVNHYLLYLDNNQLHKSAIEFNCISWLLDSVN